MDKLPKRKPNRLKDYDYSQAGYYFVTVCTKNREPLFWEAVGADIIRQCLSEYGKVVDAAINAIPSHYSNVKVDKYVIMPDHIHIILNITSDDGVQGGRMISAPTLMTVVGQMKRWVSKQVGFSLWQKSYFEHIIRDKDDYITKSEYMEKNPLKFIAE